MTTYIVANHAAEVIKVGKTSIPLKTRLAVLQNGNHQRLNVLCLVSSPHSDKITERTLHEFYADKKIQDIGAREWFQVKPDLEMIRLDLWTLNMDVEEWVRPPHKRSWFPSKVALSDAEYLRATLEEDSFL